MKKAETKEKKPATRKKTLRKKHALFDVLTCTDVQVHPVKDIKLAKTRALAKVTINQQLVLTGLRVVEGANGFFVSYPIDPNYKSEDYHSVYYPLHKELREHIEAIVLEKYMEAVNG
jgi:stage V sporulation protein G